VAYCIHDVYPAYISWETFSQIQAMLQDNYASMIATKPGASRALAKRSCTGVYCGECGPKMACSIRTVPATSVTNLRQQYRVPVCQYIAADPVDTRVVDAFFQALSPLELDVLCAGVGQAATPGRASAQAHAQHLERLR